MQRRELLTLLGALAIGRAARADAPGLRISPIGLQLYTVRKALERDFEATLARVASIGYREVEFAGYFGRAPLEVRAILDRLGLSAPSAHVPFDAIGGEWRRTLDAARAIGHRYVLLASVGGATSIEDYQRLAERFNRAGELAAQAGIRFGFHNHDAEFKPTSGKIPYDVLLESTDPRYVCFEMDLYWITKGGQDPLRYFARWPGRFELAHVKDAAPAPRGGMTDVGAGTLDWRRIFSHAAQAGFKHYFVERDDAEEAGDAFASIAASYAYLRDLRY